MGDSLEAELKSQIKRTEMENNALRKENLYLKSRVKHLVEEVEEIRELHFEALH